MSTVDFRGRRLVAVLLLVITAVTLPRPAVARADASGRGGDFVPFAAPTEVLDTRDGAGGVTGVRGPASTTTFPVLGVGNVPSTGVGAVLVRLTTVSPTAATWLTLFPDGSTRPGVTMLNVMANENLSNTAIVRPGANGRLAVYNNAGNVNLIVEVQGYFSTGTGATWGGLAPINQTRVVDTRSGVGTTVGAIAAGASRTVNLATAGVPVGASAVFATLTVPAPTKAGWLTATPAGSATSTSGILNYEDGISSVSGAALKLAADGRVTFVNKGTAAAHLVIDAMAYFTAVPTAGAGFRPATSRLTHVDVPANATTDVQVGGTNGMPTRGVAAAALSLQSWGTATGYLRAWPVGGTEPATSQTYHQANAVHRSQTIIKPGTDGKVRIRNNSSAAASVYVDLEGWFADPLPAVPVTQNSPVTVLQAVPPAGQQVGTIEYAYVDNIGRVVIGHQTNPDSFGFVQYTVISGNEAFTGAPALNQRPDGTVGVTALHTDSDLWASSQTASGAATWKAWSDLGGAMTAPPAVAVLDTGTAVAFAVDVDGKLWAYAQTGSVPFWRNLGDVNLAGAPVAVPVRDGVQVLARDNTGAVATILYRTDGSLSAWSNLGGSGADTPAVVVYPGFRLRVFVRDASGAIVTKLQDPSGTFPTAWDPVGTFTAAGPPAAILDPVLGRTAVVARGPDGIINSTFETAQGSGVFEDWRAVNTPDLAAATDPTVAPISNGSNQFWIIVFRTINGTVLVYDRRLGLAGASAMVG